MTYQALLDAMELAHPDKQQEAYQAIEDINRMMSQEIE